LNSDGTTASGYTGPIRISAAGGGLPATYTFTAADQGVHTLTGQPVTAVGSLTITVYESIGRRVVQLGTLTVQVG
jgi:hypothetical protein